MKSTTSRIVFKGSPVKVRKEEAADDFANLKDPLVLRDLAPRAPDIDAVLTVMASSSWFEERFSRLFWLLLLVAPLVAARFTAGNVYGFGVILALLGGLCTHAIVPELGRLMLAAGRSGRDLNKPRQPMLAESLGVAAGSVYLMSLVVFLPCAEMGALEALGNYTAALLSISSMLLLGFVDDVLSLKWRQKVFLPALAALPLLMIYRLTSDRTEVVVPIPIRPIFLGRSIIDIGWAYYGYMAAVSVFCTHSINILAGVNGVEIGQSLVIAVFSIVHAMLRDDSSTKLTIFLLLPFVTVSAGLLHHNWYPARIFVGDTYCYFAGMTLAVAGILGHSSKTLLLLFIPQIFNFCLSLPQLVGLLPCPRHRLPRLNSDSGRLEASTFAVVNVRNLSRTSRLILRTLRRFKLVRVIKEPTPDNPSIICTNLTVLCVLLDWLGPMREDLLTSLVIGIQILFCCFGLLIRHYLSKFVF